MAARRRGGVPEPEEVMAKLRAQGVSAAALVKQLATAPFHVDMAQMAARRAKWARRVVESFERSVRDLIVEGHHGFDPDRPLASATVDGAIRGVDGAMSFILRKAIDEDLRVALNVVERHAAALADDASAGAVGWTLVREAVAAHREYLTPTELAVLAVKYGGAEDWKQRPRESREVAVRRVAANIRQMLHAARAPEQRAPRRRRPPRVRS